MFVSYVRADIHPITFFSSSVSLQPFVSKFKQIDYTIYESQYYDKKQPVLLLYTQADSKT